MSAAPVAAVARERPIPFTGESVRAILAGTKTQTRRVIAPQPAPFVQGTPDRRDALKHLNPYIDSYCSARKTEANPRGMSVNWCWWTRDDRCGEIVARSPYGVPGDRLWLRETWGYRGGCWSTNRPQVYERVIAYQADDSRRTFIRPADDETGIPKQACRCKPSGGHDRDGPTEEHLEELERYWKSWRSSRFMPRWASRLTLEITAIRVERLQEITEEDAIAEGVDAISVADVPRQATVCRRNDFAQLWQMFNRKRAPWASNPWVWVIEFRRVA